MSETTNQVVRTVQEMLSTFWSQYPRLVEHVFQGLVLSPQHIEYRSSTLQDRDDLAAILRGLEVRLDRIENLFPQWEDRRRDTIAYLLIKAIQMDKTRRNTNIAKIVGHSASLAGCILIATSAAGVLAAGTAGIAVPTVLAGGAIIIVVSEIAYKQQESALVEFLAGKLKEDERLTRELGAELEFVSEYVGKLGRWMQDALPRPNVQTAVDANLEGMAMGAAAFSPALVPIVNGQNFGIMAGMRAAGVASNVCNILHYVNIAFGIGFSVANIAYVAHDLWKGSATAAHLRELASTLENELEQARSIYRKIQIEGERQQLLRRAEAAEVVAEVEQRRAEAAEAAAEAMEQRIRDLEAQLAMQGR